MHPFCLSDVIHHTISCVLEEGGELGRAEETGGGKKREEWGRKKSWEGTRGEMWGDQDGGEREKEKYEGEWDW